MSCIRCGSSQHTLADHKCTPSLEQIKTSLTNRNFPAHQAEAMAQFRTSRIVPNIRHTHITEANGGTSQQGRNGQEGILKDTRTDCNALTHVRRFNMSDELYYFMEERRLEAYLDMNDQNPTTYDKGTTLTLISIPIYRIHTLDPKLLCVDTGAPISCIGNQEQKRIVHSAGRDSIPMIESSWNFQFGDTMSRSKGMVELILPKKEALEKSPC